MKALPHAGKRHGETVCCAGVTPQGEWRRQYPVHFRTLKDKFSRWDWIEYDWISPKGDDRRKESRRVQENTIKVCGKISSEERVTFLNRIVQHSTKAAAEAGMSLALIRPTQPRFYWKEKRKPDLDREKHAYQFAARQLSLLDKELNALEPCKYEFKFDYRSSDGSTHSATCDDWETTAMFNNFSRQYGEQPALSKMSHVFNESYPNKGMVFAMGTHSRFPKIWLLVGVLRLDQASPQLALSL